MKWISLTLALAVAAPAMAQTPPPAPPAAAKREANAYVAAAGQADQFEIQSSRIALEKSQNAEVRRFAQMLIADHGKTTAATTRAAAKAGITAPPPALAPGAEVSIAELQNAAPADFDRIYLAQQVPAHQAALDLHQGFVATGDKTPLRDTARAAVGPVKKHLAMATRMQKATGGM